MSPLVMSFAIYFIIWWIMLFVTLPFGLRTQDDEGEIVLGTVSSAPANQNMLRKFLINTIVSSVVFAIFWIATQKFGLSFEDFDFLGPQTPVTR